MSIVQIAVIFVVIAAALAILQVINMDPTIKTIIRIIVFAFAAIVALKLLLPMAGLS